MRRSGAVEGDAGGGSVEDRANKMANTVNTNNRLGDTFNPVNVVSVRRFDEARAIGAKKLEAAEQRSRAGLGGLRVAGGRLCAVLETPAVVAGLDDVAVVRQAIEHGGCHFGVAENLRPSKCLGVASTLIN
jgi:hypothetical protein